jgi:cell wall-associated NlpC family hydrolase
MDYIVDLGSLYSLFANNSLSQISSSSSLYDYYSRDTVYGRISEIKNQYSGRQAAVNCALGIIDMAASVGKKLNYELLRGTNDLLTIDKLVTGSDCVSFASWAISQGSEKVTKTFSTQEFVNLGTKIDYSQAQVGDVFTLKYADRGGHVMLVVENHPEQGSCLVAEAGGENRGVVLTEIKYSVLQDKKYTARDLTEFYI